MPPKIVVVGSYNTDLVVYMPELPQIGETVTGHRFTTGPGGKGSNQAVAAARLGADVTFIGRVGKDNFATLGLNLWQQEGINTQYVIKDDTRATGIASILVEDSGEDMIAIVPGANHSLTLADIDAAAAAIQSADVLIGQLEVPQDTVEHALKIARSHGVKTILNPAPARKLPPEYLDLADFITPNEPEFEALAGQVGGATETEAQKLITRPDQMFIVTMGAWGAIWVQPEKHGHIASFEVQAVDTVGGGDAFNAGLAVGIGEGKSVHEAVRFANAVAALAVTKRGAAEAMPSRAEVDAFLTQQPADDDYDDE